MATKNGLSFSSPRNINLRGQGVGRGSVLLFERTNASSPVGSSYNGLYVNSSNQLSFSSQGSVTVLGGGGGGAQSLDGAYDQGRSITIDAGEIAFNDATAGAAHTFAINKTGAGSGNLIDVDITAAFTGKAIDINYGTGVAANGIHLDSDAKAHTGSDILVTDSSTGAHSVIDINSSGSGATIGFDFVGSFNGSPAGQVFNINLNAADNLDTEIMQLTTGSGDRGIMFDFDFAHTDSGATSHIWDIDMSGVFDSNVFDFATSAACTGNVLFLNMDNGLAMTALHIEGSGTRTQPFIELISDSIGSAQYIDLDITGAGSGNFIDVLVGAVTYTGNVLDIDLGATATGGQAIVLTSGAMTRTTALMEVADSGTPSGATILFGISGASTGPILDFNISGAHTGNVIDITYSAIATGDAISVVMADAVGGSALVITGAGIRTDDLIKIDDSSTGSAEIFDINISAAYTGNIFDVATSAAATGNVINIDLDAGLAATALRIDSGAGTRTQPVIEFISEGNGTGAGGTLIDINVNQSGATSNPLIDIDIATGVYAGHIIDIALGAASTGDVINIDMNAGLAASAIVIDAGGGLRTDDLIKITDDGTGNVDALSVTASNTGSGSVIDLNVSGARTGSIIDIAMTGLATANVILIDMDAAVAATAIRLDAGGGIRTQPLIETVFDGAGDTIGGTLWDIDVTNTGATASPLFDVDVTAVYTGNVFDVTFGNASASTGAAFHADMGTNLAGNALLIDAAGVRTAPLINIANTGSDGGTDDHVILITQSGVLDSNLVQLTFGTVASTGNALGITMDTNVAGMAINVSSAGTGVTGEGSAINVAHTGALVAGADVVRISSSGINSATSNVVEITASGNSTSGSYALYINASGTGVEGLRVDAGTVLFDETLVVTGAAALTAALTVTGGDFVMSDGVLRGAVSATVTSHTGSIQGNNPITRSLVELSVTANAGDANTLPSAAAGQIVIVTNHGAQSADVFPASGDAINEAAANAAKAVAVDATMLCYAYDETNWECLTLAR